MRRAIRDAQAKDLLMTPWIHKVSASTSFAASSLSRRLAWLSREICASLQS
jgi:hypothetical protein